MLASLAAQASAQQWHLSAALPDTGGGGIRYVGAVGTLISAALQTAGVFAQAEILTTFQDGLKHLAALCYLASIVSGLVALAMFGNYRQGIYLLLGPPLFLYMITTTTAVGGTQLQTGDRIVKGSVQDQVKFLSRFAQSTKFSQGAKVSYFFIGFDNVVSSVVQGIVSVIMDTKDNEDLILKGRERMFSWALRARVYDPSFIKLIAMGTFGECAEIIGKTQEILKHRVDPKKRSIEPDNLDDIGKKLRDEYNELKQIPRFQLDPEVVQYVTTNVQTQQDYASYKASCADIWDLTHQVALKYAKDNLNVENFLASGGQDSMTPWNKVEEEVQKTMAAGGDLGQAQQILAAYMVKSAIRTTTHADMATGIFNRMPFNSDRRSEIFENVASQHAYAGFLKTEYIALAMPYIQGILLYLLACAFPFFAVFLVMPSRANTFLIWASLWIWVKSWDIGFALVVVARKILWLFVQAGPNKFAAGNVPNPGMAASPLDWTRPETIFAVIGDNDPLATQNTYFTIISMLTAAVPLLTAHCCLGATGLWDVFATSLNQRADYAWTRRMKQRGRVHGASPLEISSDETAGLHAIDQGVSAQNEAASGRVGTQSPQGGAGGGTAADRNRSGIGPRQP
jgi:hypothetical protein